MTTPKIDTNRITTTMALAINKKILEQIVSKPNVRILNLEEISRETVVDWFKEMHCQEWGRFSISREDTAMATADWFIFQLHKLYMHVNNYTMDS